MEQETNVTAAPEPPIYWMRPDHAEIYLTRVWGRAAYVNPHHVGGCSLPAYSATDHNGHHLPLATDWDGHGHQVVAPLSGVWPVSRYQE